MAYLSENRILTVTQISTLIKDVLEDNFQHVWVEGEISNLSLPASGHCYFTLKDSGAQLRCVMFRASSRALRFRPKDGMGVIVRGRISLFEPRGEYQLVVDYLEPRGVGALQLAFSQLKERLAAEGLFSEEHKKPLPKLPLRIGVVTSATGAAIHDILHVLKRRYANVEVLLYPVKVQGEGAAAEIAEAVRDFNRYGKVDVLIVGRGGGSLEDLWPFNEEVVARAIYASRLPVVSAVGHEVDFTIADFVADLRAPTPSAAAEMVIRCKAELEAAVENLSHRLHQAVFHALSRYRGNLATLTRSIRAPSFIMEHLSQRVDDLSERLHPAFRNGITRRRDQLAYLRNSLRLQNPALAVARAIESIEALHARGEHALHRKMEKSRERLAAATGSLHALSPLLTLARGYSVIQKLPEAKVVTRSSQLECHELFKVILHEGSLLATVASFIETAPVETSDSKKPA